MCCTPVTFTSQLGMRAALVRAVQAGAAQRGVGGEGVQRPGQGGEGGGGRQQRPGEEVRCEPVPPVTSASP